MLPYVLTSLVCVLATFCSLPVSLTPFRIPSRHLSTMIDIITHNTPTRANTIDRMRCGDMQNTRDNDDDNRTAHSPFSSGLPP